MHVGLVIYGDLAATSGGFRYDRQLVSFLREAGDTVDVISLPWHRYARGVIDGISPAVRRQLDRPFDVLLQDELCHPSLWAQNTRLSQPDVIVSLIHHLRSDDPTERFRTWYQPFERRYLQSVDATIATSEFTQSRATTIAPTVATKPRLVAHPAGRAEQISETRINTRAEKRPLKIAFVGSLVARKDPLTLLSAVAAGIKQGRNWQLTLVGSHTADPAYANRLRQRSRTLGITDHVTIPGEITAGELETVFERSHICCVPSRYEAFGMALLEAMEYGNVPIGTTNGGPPEFIDHGVNGFCLEPGDRVTLTRFLCQLDLDRKRLAAMGRRALETAQTHPSWDEKMSEIRLFLKRV